MNKHRFNWLSRPLILGLPLAATSLACAMVTRAPTSATATALDGWLTAASWATGAGAVVFLTIAAFRFLTEEQ